MNLIKTYFTQPKEKQGKNKLIKCLSCKNFKPELLKIRPNKDDQDVLFHN